MKKILQINSVVNTGSTGRIVEKISDKVIVRGWKSYIAYGRGANNNSKSNFLKIGGPFNSLIHGFTSYFFDLHGRGSDLATKSFIKTIERINPDIVHLHNIHGYFLNYVLLFEYLNKRKGAVVWTLHDCWSFTGHCAYFSDINCNKWEKQCYSCPKINYYPKSIFKDNSKNNFQMKKLLFPKIENLEIVCVSKWLAGLVERSFFSEKKIRVINNGVDLNDFYPRSELQNIRAKYGFGQKRVLLGVATSWDKRKGLTDYIALSGKLNYDYLIVLVGLKKNAARNLPKNIIGIERIEDVHELAKLYSCAEIVLNLSYQETFGMTTVEGFACGTPGIVYDATASPELITEDTGIIVKPGNIEEIAAAIQKIVMKEKKDYSISCLQRAREMYDAEKKYNEYVGLYESLIA